MKFHIQPTHTGDQRDRGTAQTLAEQYRDLDFLSPNHLMVTLRDHFDLNGLDLRVNQVSGVVTVNSERGVIARFRSQN